MTFSNHACPGLLAGLLLHAPRTKAGTWTKPTATPVKLPNLVADGWYETERAARRDTLDIRMPLPQWNGV